MNSLNETPNMSNPSTAGDRKVINLKTPNLLEKILSLRATVGDGLNDEELTRLLRQEALPSEGGFTFVSLCEGWATFSVPPQESNKWYPERGWIAPEKEAIARALAGKCAFTLCEPPDVSSTFKSPESGSSEVHHHLEMECRSEAVVIAHLRYLKIRLFGFTAGRPPVLRRDLLEQLAALYRT
jgi:hypothetical protein